MIRTKDFRTKPYITEECIEKVADVMREGTLSGFSASDPEKLLGGKYVREFERLWAERHKVDYAISVNSATSGLITALRAIAVKHHTVHQPDQIITTPFTFSATWASIKLAGGVPVYADVDLDTMCIDFLEVDRKITDLTKAIVPVCWNSNPGRLRSLIERIAKPRGIRVIEDAAQAPGILYLNKYIGTHGDVGVYSFNQPKNITTGEGGMIVTNDDAIAGKCQLIRNHGENVNAYATGYNFRLTEMQAVIGIEQLKALDYLNQIRHKNWLYLLMELKEYQDILVPQSITNPASYCPYTIAFRWLGTKIHRDDVADTLRSEGIPVATGVPTLPAWLPNATKLQLDEYLAFFQVGWPNTEEDMADIVKGFKKVIG